MGCQEKARFNYSYIRQSYRRLLKINRVLDSLLAERGTGEAVVLFGPADEVREIFTQYLSEQGINYRIYSEKADLETVTIEKAHAHPDLAGRRGSEAAGR